MACILSVVKNFLGNQKAKNYKEIVENMAEKFRIFSVNMIIKVDFFHSHFEQFPENLGHVSTKQGKYFKKIKIKNKNIKIMDERYQEK